MLDFITNLISGFFLHLGIGLILAGDFARIYILPFVLKFVVAPLSAILTYYIIGIISMRRYDKESERIAKIKRRMKLRKAFKNWEKSLIKKGFTSVDTLNMYKVIEKDLMRTEQKDIMELKTIYRKRAKRNRRKKALKYILTLRFIRKGKARRSSHPAKKINSKKRI